MKNFKTIQEAFKESKNGITLDNIICGRMLHKEEGWVDFTLEDIDIDDLVSVLGGRKRKELRIALKYVESRGTNSLFERLRFDKNGWNYSAAQDYSLELTAIRKLLIN